MACCLLRPKLPWHLPQRIAGPKGRAQLRMKETVISLFYRLLKAGNLQGRKRSVERGNACCHDRELTQDKCYRSGGGWRWPNQSLTHNRCYREKLIYEPAKPEGISGKDPGPLRARWSSPPDEDSR